MPNQTTQLHDIGPDTTLALPPAERLKDAIAGDAPVQLTFYEGDPTDRVTIAPVGEQLVGADGEVTWEFAGLDAQRITVVVTMDAIGYRAQALLQPSVGGAVVKMKIAPATHEAVGQLQLKTRAR